MSAAEYYNSGPDATRLNTNLPPIPPSSHSNSHTNSPGSPTPSHSTVSPINKPLPLEPSFPPTHSVAGYNDGGFFGRHHSTQSIDVDTAYHPHPSGPSHSASYSNDYDKHEPYHDGIPLNDTRPQHSMSAAESGQFGSAGPGAPKKKKHRPAPYYKANNRRPWVCWILSAIQITVFVAEIARNAVLTGSPIAIKPQINPMIGPSTHVLINMGARFVPCMKIIKGVTDLPDLTYPCPNMTTIPGGCSLGEWCGFGGSQIPIQYGGTANTAQPDQWWRFIVPIFLHAGIIHIAFNMMFQLRLGVDMERDIGPIRFAVCYFASGIFGFVLGGNFAPNAQPSTYVLPPASPVSIQC